MKPNARLLMPLAAAALCGLWLAVSGAPGQPGERGRGDADRPRVPVSPERAEEVRGQLRERLMRRMELHEREGRDLQVAMRELESGKSMGELRRTSPQVRRILDQIEREGPSWREGPRGSRSSDGLENVGPDGADRRRALRGPGGGPGGGERVAHIMSVMRTFEVLDELVRVSSAEIPPSEARPERPLSDDERSAMHEYLAAAAPDLNEQLRQLHERDAEAARERYQRILPRMARVLELRASDPEMFAMVVEGAELRRLTGETARWIARHDGEPDRESQVAARRAELRSLAERVLVLSERVADRLAQRRAQSRDEIVDRIAVIMVEREKFRMDREHGLGEPGAERGGPEHGSGGERRPGRPGSSPRGERPGSGSPEGRP